MYTYKINENIVIILFNGVEVIFQDFNPENSEKFNNETAESWANEEIKKLNTAYENIEKLKFENLKIIKKLAIKKAMKELTTTAAHITSSLGFKINVGDNAIRDVAGLIILSEKMPNEKLNFRGYDNIDHIVTFEEIQLIQSEIYQYGFSIYTKKWNLLKQIDSATTLEELNTISW